MPDTLFVVSDYFTAIQKLSEMKYCDDFVLYYFALTIEFLRVVCRQLAYTQNNPTTKKKQLNAERKIHAICINE